MKKLGMEEMENKQGGWTLTCDINYSFEAWWGDSYYGYFEVSNCYFSE